MSKCYIGTHAPSPWTDATHSWYWYGRISYPEWCWCLSWKHDVGNLLYASPGAAIFGQDMLFNIPFVVDWHKIGEYRQSLTDRSNQRKNAWCIDYDYKVGEKVLLIKEGIFGKAESNRAKSHGQSQQFIQMEPWGFNVEPEQKDLISGE
jgi:hypothetical protein